MRNPLLRERYNGTSINRVMGDTLQREVLGSLTPREA